MTLKIKVQVDRLPDVTPADGRIRYQLGIRVSAVIEATATPTTAGDAQLLQPWLWLAKDDPASSWNAHLPDSWQLWRYDGTVVAPAMSLVPSTICTMSAAADLLFDGAPRAGLFDARIGAEVDDIVAIYGVAALEEPRTAGIISGRTVYGLVESLTALPSPVPACMQVWTAITVDSNDVLVGEHEQFFAIPLFGTPDVAGYEPPAAPPIANPAPDSPTVFAYSAPAGRAAVASVFPSLSAKALEIPAGSGQLIDLRTLLVRPSSAQFEGNDWSSDLALRIAEVLDPSARLMSVLDETVRKFAAQPIRVADAGPAPLYRYVLAADLIPAKGAVEATDYLRTALARVHWQVVGPRTRSSRPTAAPAASFIDRLAARSPELWSDAMLLLLAQAAADSGGSYPGGPGPMVVTRARLADAAGIVVARKDMLDEPDGKVALDNESAFRRWLADHWTAGQPAGVAPSEASCLFAGRASDVKNVGGVATVVSRRTGLIDLMQQPKNAELRIPMTLRFAGPSPQSVQFRLGVLEDRGAAETVSLHAAPFRLEAGGATYPLIGSLTDGVLVTLVLKASGDGAGRTWTLGFGIPAQGQGQAEQFLPDLVDITLLARSGKLMLAVSISPEVAGSFVRAEVGANTAAGRLRAAVVQGVQAQAMRAGLALAYSGPVIAGLMGGWIPMAGHPASTVAPQGELAARLADTIGSYIDLAFEKMGAASLEGIPETTPYEVGIRQLIGELWSAARADAKQRAATLIPSDAGRAVNRVTPDAIPLSFAVDELQDFDDTVDLWTRLAGLGVLIGRDDSAGEIQWWSLNAASLHAPQLTKKMRDPLIEDNAVVVNPASASWPMQALVDPVPLVVTESQGVRNAVIRYESQSIVAEVEKRPQLNPHGQATSVARRPEAYLFPVDRSFPKLPPLTFGRTYYILPYLIGHGGAMPPLLRGDPLDPTSRIARTAPTGFFRIDKAGTSGWVREKAYLRTVAVAAPRLSDKPRVPGLIEGVASLAAELPVIPAPITLKATDPSYFFIDRDQVHGLLACQAGAAAGAGIRIDIGGIDCSSPGTLTLSIRQHDNAAAVDLLQLPVELADLKAAARGATVAGIRVEIIDAQVYLSSLAHRAGAVAEDEPVETLIRDTDTASRPVGEWQGASIALSVSRDMDVIPPSIRWGKANAAGVLPALLVEGDKPLFPVELVPQSRSTSILDGIGAPGTRTGATSVLLAIKRPTASMAVYDRWINGALGGYGAAPEPTVREALNDAAARTTRAGGSKGENMLDDPAVKALVVEVIQLFPTRTVVSLKRLDTTFHATPEGLMGLASQHVHGTDQAFVAITVRGSQRPVHPRAYHIEVEPGRCYEVRIYGAVAKEQPYFAPSGVGNRARFAPAAIAGWRDVTIDGALLHLGAPLVHTVEVAAELMPELYSAANVPLMPFFMTMHRPPLRGRDMAAFHLLPDRIEPRRNDRKANQPAASPEQRYQALRMVDRLALIEQRWSWRGRPHPELARDAHGGFGEKGNIDQAFQEFCDMAFLGRSHDDIGPIKEKSISRHHAFGGRAQFPAGGGTARLAAILPEPIFLESELDYRGGANLWRFAIRAKSRYAAMRGDHESMLSFSHTKRFAPKVNWAPLVVPDRAHPSQGSRKPKRPGLMLVVPLTEPMSAEGTVPPLLALFNEPMFPLFHAGDGIEAVIEVARHPYPGIGRIGADTASRQAFETSWKNLESLRKNLQEALDELRALRAADAEADLADQNAGLQKVLEKEKELADAVELHGRDYGVDARAEGSPFAKYWPEFAPDPVRTGDGADGTPVAMRCDGPIGYGFDFDVQAGRFDHAGLLVSPVGAAVRPWSMVKMRFRRLEMPEFLVNGANVPLFEDLTLPKDGASPSAVALSSSYPDTLVANGGNVQFIRFDTPHEGLALDLEAAAAQPASVKISFDATTGAAQEFTQVDASVRELDDEHALLSIVMATRLGTSREWAQAVSRHAHIDVRLIVSRQFTMPDVPPRGDVSVRVRITPAGRQDDVAKADEHAWLSVICAPLTASAPPAAPGTPLVYLHGVASSPQVRVRPARLSEFTDGVWCQFAAAMSRVVVSGLVSQGASKRKLHDTLAVTDLIARRDSLGKQMGISLRQLRSGETVSDISFAAEGQPDPGAQIEERLYAVVTRYVHDAFDRLREYPNSIHPMNPAGANPGQPALGAASWTAPQVARDAPFAEGAGRIRILRVLRGKTKDKGGFESVAKQFPEDFFGATIEAADVMSMNPFDGAGQVLGISLPFEWE